MPADIIRERRLRTQAVLGVVKDAFERELGASRDARLGTRTTVFVTGSAGRGDMGPASDLDPYVVRLDDAVTDEDADAIEHALEAALRRTGLPGLDADGRHARLVAGTSLFEHLGDPEDDKSGALTKRMLLLLESHPLVNPGAYHELVEAAVDAYWNTELTQREVDLPIVLVNDIVRYWRIVLLNHESRLRAKSRQKRLGEAERHALRRYSSYKLRVPRCLSCFSALAYLLALTPTESSRLTREDIVRMVAMTPIERLEHLRGLSPELVPLLDALRAGYVRFLERTGQGKTALTDALAHDPGEVEAVSEDGRAFTKHMFDLIQHLGGGRTLHRAMVV